MSEKNHTTPLQYAKPISLLLIPYTIKASGPNDTIRIRFNNILFMILKVKRSRQESNLQRCHLGVEDLPPPDLRLLKPIQLRVRKLSLPVFCAVRAGLEPDTVRDGIDNH